MTAAEFPILGTEPLAVELANTLYGVGQAQIDFLADDRQVDRWFAEVSVRHESAASMSRHAEQVRTLRDCVHALLSAAVEGLAPGTAAVERVNGFAAAAPTFLRLDWRDGPPAARRLDTATGAAAVLGRIAAGCVELLTGPLAGRVRRCHGPGCSLFFVQHHSRRRWCHPSCGHRDRQARYYRRHLTSGAS
ncbi:CGNR zinc finger domain-containing protein [Nonomuraea sp. NPDC049400]|uniref:CGNR zinc finger domain-containing protein n=1 Tax=Nonomuraea sp. NPDC049400 TaxID=3364352 RepID=UPI00378CDEB6